MGLGLVRPRPFGPGDTDASSHVAIRACSVVVAIVVATGCAADPPVIQVDAGSTTPPCIASSPLPPPRGAEIVFSAGGLGGTGIEGAHLLGSSGGALAYLPMTSISAFGTDPVALRRYGAGGWSSPETFPEPIQHVGTIATSMAAAGETTFVWASLDAVDLNTANLHARTLTAAGSWSDRATLGDTSVEWWQEPTVPVIGAASNEAFSIAVWTRIDPAGVNSDNGLWSSERRASGAWDPPRFDSPASVGALLLGQSPTEPRAPYGPRSRPSAGRRLPPRPGLKAADGARPSSWPSRPPAATSS